MKVDMSPKAVTERLKTLDELWLLSVKLMNSKKIKSAKDSRIEIKAEDLRLGNKKTQS
jgi:hypothetical protein